MQIEKLNSMVRGWVVGNFEPAVLKTEDFEFAVQHFKAGTHAPWHYHKLATEITVIITGKAQMNGKELSEGDIIVLQSGEGADFKAITDVITAVIKTPGALNDKYLDESQ